VLVKLHHETPVGGVVWRVRKEVAAAAGGQRARVIAKGVGGKVLVKLDHKAPVGGVRRSDSSSIGGAVKAAVTAAEAAAEAAAGGAARKDVLTSGLGVAPASTGTRNSPCKLLAATRAEDDSSY
jgi:hypothetical protein